MNFQIIRAGALTAALFVPVCATAQVTADDVWASWLEMSRTYGQTMAASETSRSGNSLTLRGVTTTMETPDGSVSGTIERIVLTETGDGRVSIEVAPEYPLNIVQQGSDGERIEMSMVFRHQDLEMTASGAPEALNYAFGAPRLEVELTDATIDGEPMDLDLAFALDAVEGTYLVGGGDPQQIDSSLAAGAFAMRMSASDPEGGEGRFSWVMTMNDVTSTSAGTLSPFAGPQDFGALLRSGLSTSGDLNYGATTYTIAVTDQQGNFNLDGTAEGGTFDFALDEGGLRYGGGNSNVAMTVSLPGVPMPPMTLQIARSSGQLTFPMIASEDPQNLRLATRLEGVTLSESVWSMFDPAGALPRDPAVIELDVTGTGRLDVDLADAEAMARLETAGTPPGEMQSAAINALTLSLAGAELTGTGGFTFNNSMVPPVPSGQIDLRLVGGNALIDRLVQIGLLPEDQAMGARMMLGLFAIPGQGEDTLTSTVEFREDGSILANGQRIR